MALGLVYLRVILSRWRLVLALVALTTLMAWGISVFYLATKPKFEAAARLNIVPTAEELGYASRFVRGTTFDGGSVLLGTYAEFAHTRPVVEPIVDRYIAEAAAAQGMSPSAWLTANTGPPSFSPGRILAILNYGEAPVVPLREEIIEELIENTKIETIEGTYLIRLGVEWEDARSAAWFSNALADAIIARAERASRSTGREIAGTLEARLAAKRSELAGLLRQSRGLKSSIGVVDLDRQKTSLLEARLTEQAQLTTDRAALDAAKSQVAALRQQSGGKLTGAQSTVEQTLAVEAPRAAGLAQSVAIRAARIGQLDRQIAGLGGSEDRVKSLDERAALLQQEVNALTERVSFSQTENLANGPRIQLIERATPPKTRSSPKIFFNTVLGFIGGCALAACALLLLGPAPPRAEPAQEDERVEPIEPVADEADAEPTPTSRPTAKLHAIHSEPVPAASAEVPPPHVSHPGEPVKRRPSVAPLVAVSAALKREDAPAPEPIPVPVSQAVEPPRPPVVDERFPGTLPRPANGESYTSSEAAAIQRTFGTWLFEQLAADARGLFIGAVTHEADARQLAQLTHFMLGRAGIQLAVVDGRQAGARADRPGKPFVYVGPLDATAAQEALAAMPPSAHLVLATREGDPLDWRNHHAVDVPRAAYVVAFG
ncbi:hypothetical protein [Sphingomonas radiodurans]|uniref:hypothetical protein n=1 Tax=Sphingomonas radiodurans TaxID=2890321 RepID=UPI001E4FE1E7|nr:hypothetical protein [Sphingomonas radiodurans]WBH17825.1 hypothetical protein LLW23_06915 [Sphingomonas radiodurans]